MLLKLGECTYLTDEYTNSSVADVVTADVKVGAKESIYDSLVKAVSWQQLDNFVKKFDSRLEVFSHILG